MGANPLNQMQLGQCGCWATTLVLMFLGDQRGILELPLGGAPLVVDRTVVGVGGRDSDITSPIAGSTVYDLRVVCDLRGEQAGLIATTSGVDPTLPVGYVWQSPVLFVMVTNGAQQLISVADSGNGIVHYDDSGSYGLELLVDGKAVVLTPIDCSPALPSEFTRFGIYGTFEHAAVGARVCSLEHNPAHADTIFETIALQSLAGAVEQQHVQVQTHGHPPPSEALYYQWLGGAPTVGATIWMQWFQIPRI